MSNEITEFPNRNKQAIKYRLEMDDLAMFIGFHNFRSEAGIQNRKKVRVILSFFMAGIYFMLGLILYYASQFVVGLLTPFMFAGIGVVFFNLMYNNQNKNNKFIKKLANKRFSKGENKTILCDHTLEISEFGISSKTEHSESKISWGALERIEIEPDYTYLYISAENAYIIPHKKITEGDLPSLLTAIKIHYKPGQLLEPAKIADI